MRKVEEERRRWMKGEEIEEMEREEEGGNVGGESVRVKDEREREMRRRQSLIERCD